MLRTSSALWRDEIGFDPFTVIEWELTSIQPI